MSKFSISNFGNLRAIFPAENGSKKTTKSLDVTHILRSCNPYLTLSLRGPATQHLHNEARSAESYGKFAGMRNTWFCFLYILYRSDLSWFAGKRSSQLCGSFIFTYFIHFSYGKLAGMRNSWFCFYI